MIITSGRHKGTFAILHQMTNDQVSGDADGVPVRISPTHATYTSFEIVALQAQASGRFWDHYAAQELPDHSGYCLRDLLARA